MNAQWRKLEELVTRIEQALAPAGAIVKSPDRIPDKVTGEPRESDASIRYQVGTVPVLITLECRDRSSVQDVRWMEELAEKKRSIGASITVAVSSSGFTGPAVKKASAAGIEVRTLTDAASEDFLQWSKTQSVLLDMSEWQLSDLAIELYDAPNGAELVPSVQRSFRDAGPLAPILVRNSDGKKFTIQNILIEWCKRNGNFLNDLPADGTRIQRNLHQPLTRNGFYMETTKGSFDIRMIHIGLQLWRSKTSIPVSTLTEYSDSSLVLVQTAGWNLQERARLSLHRNMRSGETKVTMTLE